MSFTFRHFDFEDLRTVLEFDDLSWHDRANCKGANADLFFPERGASTRTAKSICRECLVRRECLEVALRSGAEIGMFAGLSERGGGRHSGPPAGAPPHLRIPSRTPAPPRRRRIPGEAPASRWPRSPPPRRR